MSKKSFAAFGLALLILFSSVSASATTYISATLTGTTAETGYKKLGSGKRYIKGTGTYGTGTAFTMKVIKLWPDKAVASINLSNGNKASSSFTAQDTNDDGENQSYYIRWLGNSSKASAKVSITD